MESLLLDIQRASQHDGPGVRTTIFLKGCPLKCKWCHNPESQSFKKQLSYNNEKCVSCHKCEKVCANGVHTFSDNIHKIDYSKCKACGKCIGVCPSDALQMYGKDINLADVIETVLKDRKFYEQTGGGVTVSGGEPLCNPEITYKILKECKYNFINTCIETSGYGKEDDIRKILSVTDIALVDYKVESKENLKWLGIDNDTFPFTLLDIAREINKPVILRCPVIPDVNDNEKHFNSIIEICITYKNIIRAEILPYHTFGVSKAHFVGRDCQSFKVPDDSKVNEWLLWFKGKTMTEIIRG